MKKVHFIYCFRFSHPTFDGGSWKDDYFSHNELVCESEARELAIELIHRYHPGLRNIYPAIVFLSVKKETTDTELIDFPEEDLPEPFIVDQSPIPF